MKLKVNFIDAFTDTVFKGNSAAVIVLDAWLDKHLMQAIATENNLSETAFIVKTGAVYHIRWFSPLTEIDFCGHATLASAFVLFNQLPDNNVLAFHAQAVGEIEVTKQENGFIQMDFPNRKPKRVTDVPQALIDGLSILPDNVHQNEQAYFVVYPNETDVLEVIPDTVSLKMLAPFDVVVTAQGKSYDFISRYFWPANGGDEDPVTGSIHAGLAPFWAEALDKDRLLAQQASTRGGELSCLVKGDRVFISGQAVQYLTGEIEL